MKLIILQYDPQPDGRYYHSIPAMMRVYESLESAEADLTKCFGPILSKDEMTPSQYFEISEGDYHVETGKHHIYGTDDDDRPRYFMIVPVYEEHEFGE
jgi:hypothetical protein